MSNYFSSVLRTLNYILLVFPVHQELVGHSGNYFASYWNRWNPTPTFDKDELGLSNFQQIKDPEQVKKGYTYSRTIWNQMTCTQ